MAKSERRSTSLAPPTRSSPRRPRFASVANTYVTGYMTTEESGEAPYRTAYVFRHHAAHGNVLPEWPLIARAYPSSPNP